MRIYGIPGKLKKLQAYRGVNRIDAVNNALRLGNGYGIFVYPCFGFLFDINRSKKNGIGLIHNYFRLRNGCRIGRAVGIGGLVGARAGYKTYKNKRQKFI